MLMISEIARMNSMTSLFLVLMLLMTMMREPLILKLLSAHTHLHGIALMTCSTIHHAMLALLMTLAVHSEGNVRRRLWTRRASRRRRIVGCSLSVRYSRAIRSAECALRDEIDDCSARRNIDRLLVWNR